MKIKIGVTISIFLIIFFASGIAGAFQIDKVSYIVSGKVGELEALKIKIDSNIDQINQINLEAVHDGEDINLMGSWNLFFTDSQLYDIWLELNLAVDLDEMDLGKAIGLGGEGNYLKENKYFWSIDYFFDKINNNWVYEGGVALPLTNSSYFTLSIGNSYWLPDKNLFNLGVEVKL